MIHQAQFIVQIFFLCFLYSDGVKLSKFVILEKSVQISKNAATSTPHWFIDQWKPKQFTARIIYS